MKSCYFGRKRWYDADCVKYNKLIELKNDFCEKFKDIELEIDK